VNTYLHLWRSFIFDFLAAACKAVLSRTRSRSIIAIRLDTNTIRIEEPESLSKHFFGEPTLIYYNDIQLLLLLLVLLLGLCLIIMVITVIIHHISFKNT